MLSLFNIKIILFFYLTPNPEKDFHFIISRLLKTLLIDSIKVHFILGLFIELKQTKIWSCEVQV